MDNLGLNRLNFSNIVDKHLRGLPETKYFNATQVNVNSNKWSKNIKSTKAMMHDHLNIQGKIDSIVAYVHTQLKDRKPSRTSKPETLYAQSKDVSHEVVAEEQEIYENLSPANPDKSSVKPSKRAKTDNIIIDNPSGENKHIVIDNPANRKIGIPRIKVLCSHKEKKRLHHTIPPSSGNNHYVLQQRFKEAKRQNELYENMLQDQKKLQHDRRSIEQEMFTMRSYLDDIRGRLDNSLKNLDDNKTYCTCHPVKEQLESKTQSINVRRRSHLKSTKKQNLNKG